jgi:hypothetical protein
MDAEIVCGFIAIQDACSWLHERQQAGLGYCTHYFVPYLRTGPSTNEGENSRINAVDQR